MANNTNKKLVPEAMSALDKFKYEVASDVAVKNIFKIIFNKLLSKSYFIFFVFYLILRDLLISIINSFRFFYCFTFIFL